jgi:hypothetical protein
MWWKHWNARPVLYKAIAPLKRVLVQTRVTKTHALSFKPTSIVFADTTVILAFHDNRYFSLLNSSFHEYWAWKTSSTMKGDRRYSPTDSFETFPFPEGLEPSKNPASSVVKILDELGEKLDKSRREIMLRLDIGLTKLYSLYHNQGLSSEVVAAESNCTHEDVTWASGRIAELRELQRQTDEAVRDAYSWNDLALDHGFYALEFLPENDRVRFTVSNEARREMLKRLLELNHKHHQEEVYAGLVDEKGKPIKKKVKKSKLTSDAPLFSTEEE